MIALSFKLHLKEPLLMTAIEGDPNSAVSLPFVPGSALRGVLVRRYLDKDDISDLAANDEARKLFFDGQTQYLNAYPVDSHGNRALPTPQAWKKRKGDQEKYPIYDLSIDPHPHDLNDQQPKPLRQPFCEFSGKDKKEKEVKLYPVLKQINVHTLRERTAGRATADEGAVFRYEALAPGQVLAGVILCPTEAVAKDIQSLLEQEDTLLLGGSQSAGYGLTKITDIERAEAWEETPNLIDKQQERLTLTLLSDAILRDANGQPTGFLTPEILAEALDVNLTLDRARTSAQTGVIGGFNRKWGLPLPQMPVARAGSVFTFDLDETDDPARLAERLQHLVETGIGERRAEGFGRVAINWHAHHVELTAQEIKAQTLAAPKSSESPEITGASAKLAGEMAKRMLRRQLDTRLRDKILHSRVNGPIRNTQLSAIRTRVRNALATEAVADVVTYLKEMKTVAQEQFERTKINGIQADSWLTQILEEDADATWKRLHTTDDPDTPAVPTVGNVRADWNTDLARKYALRLIDGILSHELAQRRKKKEAL